MLIDSKTVCKGWTSQMKDAEFKAKDILHHSKQRLLHQCLARTANKSIKSVLKMSFSFQISIIRIGHKIHLSHKDSLQFFHETGSQTVPLLSTFNESIHCPRAVG
jgi:hypothetical protein